jgi:hypothetical protein
MAPQAGGYHCLRVVAARADRGLSLDEILAVGVCGWLCEDSIGITTNCFWADGTMSPRLTASWTYVVET